MVSSATMCAVPKLNCRVLHATRLAFLFSIAGALVFAGCATRGGGSMVAGSGEATHEGREEPRSLKFHGEIEVLHFHPGGDGPR